MKVLLKNSPGFDVIPITKIRDPFLELGRFKPELPTAGDKEETTIIGRQNARILAALKTASLDQGRQPGSRDRHRMLSVLQLGTDLSSSRFTLAEPHSPRNAVLGSATCVGCHNPDCEALRGLARDQITAVQAQLGFATQADLKDLEIRIMQEVVSILGRAGVLAGTAATAGGLPPTMQPPTMQPPPASPISVGAQGKSPGGTESPIPSPVDKANDEADVVMPEVAKVEETGDGTGSKTKEEREEEDEDESSTVPAKKLRTAG